MSTDIPTPNPAADPDVYADNLRLRRAIEDLTVERDFARTETKSIYDTCKQIERERDQIIADLPARDARIRAEVAEEIAATLDTFAANRREQNPKDLVAASYGAAARHVRERAGKGFQDFAAGSAVPTEGSGLAAMLRAAAAGRKEYAENAPDEHRKVLEIEAATLDSAARLAEGDTSPMYSWLPSRRWTPEMTSPLHRSPGTPGPSAEGSGHPHPATDAVTTPETWVRRADCDPDCTGHLPILSNDTPEGDTAPDQPEWMAMGDGWTLRPQTEGEIPLPTAAVAVAYRHGLAAGRTAAAAEIRAEIVDGQMPTLKAMNAAFEHAARVAENGADHAH